MKKKNLLILLLIPFLVSTMTIVTVNVTYNTVDADISFIEWSFDDIEARKVSDNLYPLSAKGVNQRHTDVGKGNELTWSVKNSDEATTAHAEITQQNGSFYLKALSDGEAVVTCSNVKGNVSRSFKLIVYTNGAVIIDASNPFSNYGKIDQTRYFGQYDLTSSTEKTQATFGVTVKLIPESLKDANPVISFSENLFVDLSFDGGKAENGGYTSKGTVSIKSEGDSFISVKTDIDGDGINGGEFSFSVVKDGVNVYTYDDLLYCTNRSENGEIVVLQKSFESYNSYRQSTDSSSECFGYLDSNGKFKFSVDDGTLYKFNTKYNHEYLDQWNKQNPDKRVEPVVYAALRVQKDFYGNGYGLNFHNLTYPTKTTEQGGTVIPTLGENDIFRGPLPFYTVGNPSSSGADGMNIVTAYGQDNIGFYVDGDGITVNDVKVQNCDDVTVFSFLETVGTVVEVDGDNVTLKNMRMSNGKHVLRSFSSQNLVVSNSMLSNAMNFLFITGANEYVKVNDYKDNTFTTPTQTITQSLNKFLTAESIANSILNDYLNGKVEETAKDGKTYSFKTKAQMKKILEELQNALSVNLSEYKGSTELKDCLFYRSGIASVAFESLFNGPFLYSSALPTSISTFLNLFNGGFMPQNVSGTSYPVTVNVNGNTKFYDYKAYNNLDVSGLISENISTMAQRLGKTYTIDNIFPIKSLLSGDAVYYENENVKYVNIPFVYYGGGKNYSRLTFNGFTDNHVNGRINSDNTLDEQAVKKVNLLDNYLDLPVVDPVGFLGKFLPQSMLDKYGIEVDENTLIKTVTIVTGYEPFKFVFQKGDGYLFGESPKIEEMQALAKTQSALNLEVENA